jgi:DNA-binding NarL/FixJ family response regulator
MKPLNIVVADDQLPFREQLSQALRESQQNKIVGQAKDGYEAVLLAKIFKPDVVFLDISMPGINGFEAARQIQCESPDSKIVFLTVHEEKTFQSLAELFKIDGYLPKADFKAKLPKLMSSIQNKTSPLPKR